ncbi:MAG: hypothetical protein ACI389_05730 [Methanobrevibacter sp.]|uniref:hypothetical protein n=1 Tax=Methanobrevibacter sp. TaxID=66852 RepID=UPI003F023CB3
MYFVRANREELAENDPEYNPFYARMNIKTDECVEFVKKYSQFKDIIESIVFNEIGSDDIVKEIPIDEYLAKYAKPISHSELTNNSKKRKTRQSQALNKKK